MTFLMRKPRVIFVVALLAIVAGLLIAQEGALAAQDDSAATAAYDPALAKTYYFTWYDSMPKNGMTGDWVIIGNLEDHKATAQVFFGKETKPRATYEIPARGRQPVQWPDTMGGPVKVVSPNGDTLVVTQRVLYGDTFNEVAAVEKGNIASVGSDGTASYYFTWYDSKPENGMKGNWILVSNVDDEAASVDVYIGPNKMGSYRIAAGDQITPQYQNTMGGPVRVISKGGQELIVSQRVLYEGSFNEVTGMPADELDTVYYFTWYDMVRSSGMKGNWILMSNVNDTPVLAEVFIGTSPMPRGKYVIAPHQSVTPTYAELMDGPVRVVCTGCPDGKNILVSQRILYKGSFEEVQGTPPAGLGDELYFGWYDSKKANFMNGNWVLIANQGVSNAVVDVNLGSSTTPIGTYRIGEGDRVTPQYYETMDGPLRVTSRGGQPLMVSQRVLFKDSFNELLGLTKQDVGAPIAAGPDLTLYRLNVRWASYSDYEKRLLSVDMRVGNTGQGAALNTSVFQVTATNGVTVSTPVPMALGEVAGQSHVNFTIKYKVPESVTSFRTSVQGKCQDADGVWLYYPE